MATNAAVLSVLVEANTRSAMTSLSRFDSALKRTDKTTATATTRTSTLGKATRTTGGHLASAAKYAAGAAAAYISIGQAKSAITTTQDLAKTTAGLNRNLGLSVKNASQWGAVAKSRDIDTKSLTMSFTTLSRRLVDTSAALKEGGSAADTAYAPFKRLGISQQEVVTGSKDLSSFLPQLADGFGNAAGGAERQASAQQLLGRGYQTILPLFAEGAKGLKEQQEWADKYGATLNSKTVKAQMDLVSAQRESKVAVLGLQVSFATFLAPALEKANDLFQRLAKIVGSDELTNAEKFEKLGTIISRWATKAYEVFIGILPKMAEKAGEKAPEIAKALVQGFMNADAWGKLVLGGWFLSALGGASAFRGVGNKVGEKIVAGLAARFGASGGLISAALIAPVAGALAGLAFTQTKTFDAFEDSALKVKDGTAIVEAYRDRMAKTRETLVKFGKSSVNLGFNMVGLRKNIKNSGEEVVGFGDDLRETIKDVQAFERQVTKSGNDVGSAIEKVGGKFMNFGVVSGKTKNIVGGNIVSLANTVKGGLENIANNTNEALKGFGVKKVAFSFATVGAAAAGTQKKQQGGVIVPGQGNGDKVPAMLEPGEVVWNKKAVAAMGGAQRANEMNKKVRRFATGGVVPGDTGGMHPGILNFVSSLYQRFGGSVTSGLRASDSGSLHSTGQAADYVPRDWAGASRAVNAVGSSLLEGIYNPGSFGGSPVSWDSGAHVSSSFWGSEWGNHLDHIHLAIADGAKVAATAVAKKIKDTLLKGPDGPMKAIGQAAFDQVTSAANKFISSKTSTGDSGMDIAGKGTTKNIPDDFQRYNHIYQEHNSASGDWGGYRMPLNHVAAIAEWAGMPGISMAKTAIGESNLRPGATGIDPGGTKGLGLWMVTTGFNDALIAKLGGEANMRNPILNAIAANEIFQSQGIGAWYSATADSSNTHYTGTFGKHQMGGIIQALAKGGKVKGPGNFGVTGGAGGTGPGASIFSSGNTQYQSWKNVKDKVAALQGSLPYLESAFSEAQIRAGFVGSEAGVETGPGELAKQVFIETGIISNLKAQARLIKKGMHGVPKSVPLWKSLNEQLLGLQGLGGTSGRILDEQDVLNGLRVTGSSSSSSSESNSLLQELLAAANRQNALYRAQMPVFAGAFATGGRIPAGQWGIAGEAGPEVVTGPAQVYPTGAAPTVEINFANGMEWLGEFIEVKVDGVNRKTARTAERRTPTKI